METWLKHGEAGPAAEADAEVCTTVGRILDDVARRGDAAVRELSARLDGWDRDDYRLTPAEVQDCLARLGRRDLDDIAFAQEQVRTFARHQRRALRDLEVETLPGVILGHKNIPVGSAGCYVPGGKYPMVASAHMSVVTAKVAGRPADRHLRTAVPGAPAAAIVAAQHLAGADEIYCLGGVQAVAAMALGTRVDRRRSTCWSARATPTWPRPSGSSSAASGSTCWPARRRPWSSPTRPSTRSCAPRTSWGRPSTAPTPRPSC